MSPAQGTFVFLIYIRKETIGGIGVCLDATNKLPKEFWYRTAIPTVITVIVIKEINHFLHLVYSKDVFLKITTIRKTIPPIRTHHQVSSIWRMDFALSCQAFKDSKRLHSNSWLTQPVTYGLTANWYFLVLQTNQLKVNRKMKMITINGHT